MTQLRKLNIVRDGYLQAGHSIGYDVQEGRYRVRQGPFEPYVSDEYECEFYTIPQIPEIDGPWYYVLHCPWGLVDFIRDADHKAVARYRKWGVSEEVREGIESGNGFLLLIDHHEGPPANASLLKTLRSHASILELPENKVVYYSANKLCREHYEGKTDIHMVYYPFAEGKMSLHFDDVYDRATFTGLTRKYKMLCLNRRPRSHRTLAVAYMARHGMLTEDTLISFPGEYPDQKIQSLKMMNPPIDEGVAYTNDFLSVYETLPLVLDTTAQNTELADTHIAWPYASTYFSLVTETQMRPEQLFFSEKTFKPIISRHPFVMMGSQYALRELWDMGYHTFDFDESYDTIADPYERAIAALNSAREIWSMSQVDLHQWYINQVPILEHNLEVLQGAHEMIPSLHKELWEIVNA